MEAKEYLKLVTDKTEAGDLIKENNLTEAVIKMLDNYSEIRVKNCSIPDVSQQRELLKNFLDWADGKWLSTPRNQQCDEMFDEFFNCC